MQWLSRSLLAQNHRIDAGVMQVTDANWGWLGLTVDTVFDPARNVCAGKRVLADAYAAERRVSCRYNSGRPNCTNGYPDRIEAAMVQHIGDGSDPTPVQLQAEPAPPPSDPS